LKSARGDQTAYNGGRKEATMSHHRLHIFMLLTVSLIPGTTRGSFGPGEASAHSSQRVGQRADFKVAIWYRKSDSLGTFKYQIYDMQKGEYTAKVDEWMKEVRTKYPGYYVVVQDVDLKREKGETDLLKVGSVIYRELIVAASFAGVEIGSRRSAPSSEFFGLGGGPQNTGSNRARGLNRMPGTPGRDRDYLKPAATQFPVPVPFPHLPR
jgi:hypothetical protein